MFIIRSGVPCKEGKFENAEKEVTIECLFKGNQIKNARGQFFLMKDCLL